jgi:glycosylphosphatidylinositol transamidase
MIKRLRNSPLLPKLPPYLALLAMLGGLVWILLLPLNEYSRQTYISENALLPGQVHTYFGGSEQNVFRAYRHELASVLTPEEYYGLQDNSSVVPSQTEVSVKLQQLFRNAGLKTARQTYSYTSSGKIYAGENVYAVLHAPRGDGTEAIVLVAALKNIDDLDNLNGVTLLITLARYFNRWSLWSKDIIFLVTADSKAGPQAWIDAYHSTHDPATIGDLSLKSGALQAAVCMDYPFTHHFSTVHVAYDGINGQLPNLDLFNTAVSIISGQMGIGAAIQHMHAHGDSYLERLQTLARGMASQAVGHATGPHSVFMPYHIDAVTLSAVGEGWQDEMALGRAIESICRSLNNLLEHLHQSFFFYLLMQSNRFVSIGTYLPSAMAIAAGYTIVALWLWWRAGKEDREKNTEEKNEDEVEQVTEVPLDSKTNSTTTSAPATTAEATDGSHALILPLALVATIHILLPALPVYLFTRAISDARAYPQVAFVFAVFSLIFPVIIATSLPEMPKNTSIPAFSAITPQQYTLARSLSLLWLGACLTVLATVNFSLGLVLGVVCVPVVFLGRTGSGWLAGLYYIILVGMSPVGVTASGLVYLVKTGAATGRGGEHGADGPGAGGVWVECVGQLGCCGGYLGNLVACLGGLCDVCGE